MAANSFFMAPAGRARRADRARGGRKPTTKHSSDDVLQPGWIPAVGEDRRWPRGFQALSGTDNRESTTV